MNILGILPCAGTQTRMRELVFAKELLPLFDGRPIIKHSLDALRLATDHIVAYVHPKKTDLIKYLKKQQVKVMVGTSPGLPLTIARSANHHSGPILFALPDTYYQPLDCFKKLAASPYPNLLGLFDSGTPERFDSVKLNHHLITRYQVKIDPPLSPWTMGCGKLSPEAINLFAAKTVNRSEPLFGVLIQPLIKKKQLHGLCFPHSRYFDLGTPTHYLEYLIHRFHSGPANLNPA